MYSKLLHHKHTAPNHPSIVVGQPRVSVPRSCAPAYGVQPQQQQREPPLPSSSAPLPWHVPPPASSSARRQTGQQGEEVAAGSAVAAAFPLGRGRALSRYCNPGRSSTYFGREEPQSPIALVLDVVRIGLAVSMSERCMAAHVHPQHADQQVRWKRTKANCDWALSQTTRPHSHCVVLAGLNSL
jgi:hypothetical protein